MDEILEQVKQFTDKAHGAQTRKYSDERYIVHPIRVMEICKKYTPALPILSAALLHDVLEDTSVRQNEMHAFLLSIMNEQEAKQTTALVIELTDVYTKEKYPRWNRRRRKTKEAERIQETSGESQTVKYADIIDNCKEIVLQDPEFAAVFLRECKMLLRQMPKGNQQLYNEAVETVDECLRRVPLKFKKRGK